MTPRSSARERAELSGDWVGTAAGGAAYAWGRNIYGQLGDGTTTDRHAPVSVSITGNVTAVAGGDPTVSP